MKPYHIIKRNTADQPFRLRKNKNSCSARIKTFWTSLTMLAVLLPMKGRLGSKKKPSCLTQKGSFTLKLNLKLQPIKFAFTGIFLYLNVSDHWAVVLPTGTFDLNSS